MPKKDNRIDELTADLQRVQADFVNFRRRSEEQSAEFMNLAKQDVILQLLPVLDNIDRALGHLPEELKDNPWAKGVETVAKQAQDTLKNLGIEKIEAVGQSFDHNFHEAIAVEGDGNEEVVIEELQPGYKLGEKVIRHSIVKVGRK
jgi:molecular chaperone GrpE